MRYGTVLLCGASSGIGLAVAEHLAPRCRRLITSSRRPAPVGEWVPADLRQVAEIERLARHLEGQPLDALLFLGGTWEREAFTERYSFEECSAGEIEEVLAVNLAAPIHLIQRLLPNLRAAEAGKIVLIGAALGGLDGQARPEVANGASKHGLRGLVQALRPSLRPQRIGITLIQPGWVATPEVLADLEAAGQDPGRTIPLEDLIALIECALALSNRSNLTEVELTNQG
jgi:NAD(P)-dependent dehydrogenase (short-subunit alcohol dehydrogenase family)